MQKLTNSMLTANKLLEAGWLVKDMKLSCAGSGEGTIRECVLILLEKF